MSQPGIRGNAHVAVHAPHHTPPKQNGAAAASVHRPAIYKPAAYRPLSRTDPADVEILNLAPPRLSLPFNSSRSVVP